MTRKESLTNDLNTVLTQCNAIIDELTKTAADMEDTVKERIPRRQRPLNTKAAEELRIIELQTEFADAKKRLDRLTRLQSIIRYYATPEGVTMRRVCNERLDQISAAWRTATVEAAEHCRYAVQALLGDNWTSRLEGERLAIGTADAEGNLRGEACDIRYGNSWDYRTDGSEARAFDFNLSLFGHTSFDPIEDEQEVAYITAIGKLVSSQDTIKALHDILKGLCDRRDALREERSRIQDVLTDPLNTRLTAA